ncbi:MAG: class I SAM-dependent methyltransferase, partial [Gammaproteobacteria bacterium]
MNDIQEVLDEDVTASPVSPAAGLPVRLARRGVHDMLASLRFGRLQIQDYLGSRTFGAATAGPDVSVRITDPTAYLDIATAGTIGAAEAYMQGKWTASDLAGLVRLLVRNREVMNRLESGVARIGGALLKVAHWYHRNTRAGSRRNIHAHYDLGNELFQLFLDPTMMYSSAVFPRPDASLEEASVHKLDLICRKLNLQPADHLLEIGTGWGGLALHAARNYGCRVTTTTISRNQFDVASERIRKAGLVDRVTIISKDYRDL